MDANHLQRLRRMLEQVDPSWKAEGLQETLQGRAGAAGGPRLELAKQDAQFAMESLDVLKRGEDVDADQRFALEAIIMPYHRPVIDIVGNRMKPEQLTGTWQHLAGPELRPRIEQCLLSVGRINVPHLTSLPYAGTGFIVGPELMMTNRHVAQIFAQGLGVRNLQFLPGQVAAVDFHGEAGREESLSLDVERVVMVHPYWDMALLKVRGLPEDRKPLTLGTTDPANLRDHEIVVVGYPGYDPGGDDEFQRIQNRIFRGTYYVKRLQPGNLKVRGSIESFGRMVDAVTHDCSTLGGNSGSAVLALPRAGGGPIQVIGLHFGGAYLVANYAVPAFDLAQDGRVVDAGVNFAGRIDGRGGFYDPYWREAEVGESFAARDGSPAGPTVPPASAGTAQTVASGAAVTWTIPLQVTISLGAPTLAPVPAPAPGPAPAQVSGPAPAPTPVTAPAATRATAAGEARRAAVEALFRRQPPRPTSDLPYPFSADSLSATGFSWPAALSTAMASRLAYEESAAVMSTAQDRWKMEGCAFVEKDDTQCFVARTPGVVLIAFRGTESLGDWLADLNVLSTERTYGVVHRGFLSAFQAVEPQLRLLVSGFPDHDVVITGHSLGGALATVAAAEWRGQFRITRLYTFGQPAVGKGGFPEFFRASYPDTLFRFVNDDDVVPRVPPTFQHVGRLLHFDASGNLPGGTESPVVASRIPRAGARPEAPAGPPTMSEVEFDRLRAALLQRRASRRDPAAPSTEAPVLEGVLPSVSDHSLDLYITKIAAKARA